MKVLCYSVRLSSLTSISEKAYKAGKKFVGTELNKKRLGIIVDYKKNKNFSKSWEIEK